MQTVYIGNTLINDVFLGSKRMDDLLTKFIGFDQNVKNFVLLTGINDLTTINALDTFVTTLKSDGIWDKLYSLYPFVGSTQSTNRVNLIDTGSYLLSFTGSWTFSNDGVASNGTDAFANTQFTPSSIANNFSDTSYAVFTRTNSTSSGYDIGGEDDSIFNYLITKNAGNKSSYAISRNILTTINDVTGSGFFIGTISGSSTNNVRLFRNGTSIASKTTVMSASMSLPLYFGANNFRNNFANAYTSESYSLMSIGRGLTDTEANNFNNAVQTLQTNLNRAI